MSFLLLANSAFDPTLPLLVLLMLLMMTMPLLMLMLLPSKDLLLQILSHCCCFCNRPALKK